MGPFLSFNHNDRNRFGGERLDSISSLARNNLLEHLARYELVAGDGQSVVLDIGCGSGHGSHALAKKFRAIYGVDVSLDAIEYARTYWPAENIKYLAGSGTNMPFPDETFGISVAFEVFEHIANWSRFLQELKRVTKRQGTIYISTPNKEVYAPGRRKSLNTHHHFEMTVPEFKCALRRHFTIEKFFGQRTPIYNDHWIWPVVNPVLATLHSMISYGMHNTIKLKIINWIKPKLEMSDIIFSEDDEVIRKSRYVVAVCRNGS